MFNKLGIDEDLIASLKNLGYVNPTNIQKESIPYILEGKDVAVQGKTGSGKTLAFALAAVSIAKKNPKTTSSIVITPTRELAEQVATEIRKVGKAIENLKVVTLYGGTSVAKQTASLEKGADILVVTVGRVLDLFSKEALDLSGIKAVVIDEADKMLDMGFYDDLLKILNRVPKDVQTMLFSATYKEKTEKLIGEILKNPVTVKADLVHDEGVIKESFYGCSDKQEGLVKILKIKRPASAIVFANTKADTETIADFLEEEGFDILLLNGNLEQYEREEVMIRFANKSVPVLVATDVASRGLDIEDLDLVVNYDFPFKEETYTHRIGRTARAGKEGEAVSLFFKKQTPPEGRELLDLDQETVENRKPLTSNIQTLCINGGKKSKIRKGDVLGTLIKDLGVANDSIGRIDITDRYAYVAISKTEDLDIERIKIKGKSFKVWLL